MDRRTFIKAVAALSGLGAAGLAGYKSMSSTELKKSSKKKPVLFVGHGSPMNIVDSNEFTRAMKKLGQSIKPQAILVVSAHWQTRSQVLQNAADQKTIYDFGGFPEELYKISYPAHGWHDGYTAKMNSLGLENFTVTDRRGLDHGTWAVLHHMYPRADIPVVQLSIPARLPLFAYFELGQKLAALREYGVLIMGSGNIVHNLGSISWQADAKPFEWAVDFDRFVEYHLSAGNFEKLLTADSDEAELFGLAHPSSEHYIPLLYALGAAGKDERVSYPVDFIQNGSISMRSVLLG